MNIIMNSSSDASVPVASMSGEEEGEGEEDGEETNDMCVSQAQLLAWTKFYTAQLIKTEERATRYKGAMAVGLMVCIILCACAIALGSVAYNAAIKAPETLPLKGGWNSATLEMATPIPIVQTEPMVVLVGDNGKIQVPHNEL